MARQPAPDDPGMNMTPMVDVVFLLIVFFLCLDFRQLELREAAYLPKDKGGGPTPQPLREALTVQVICTHFGKAHPRGQGSGQGFGAAGAGHPPPATLVGHQVQWQVNGIPLPTEPELHAFLARVIDDRLAWQRHPQTGQLMPPPIVIQPSAGVVHQDVVHTIGQVKAAGFLEVNFCGSRRRTPAGSPHRVEDPPK